MKVVLITSTTREGEWGDFGQAWAKIKGVDVDEVGETKLVFQVDQDTELVVYNGKTNINIKIESIPEFEKEFVSLLSKVQCLLADDGPTENGIVAVHFGVNVNHGKLVQVARAQTEARTTLSLNPISGSGFFMTTYTVGGDNVDEKLPVQPRLTDSKEIFEKWIMDVVRFFVRRRRDRVLFEASNELQAMLLPLKFMLLASQGSKVGQFHVGVYYGSTSRSKKIKALWDKIREYAPDDGSTGPGGRIADPETIINSLNTWLEQTEATGKSEGSVKIADNFSRWYIDLSNYLTRICGGVRGDG